MNCSLSFLLSLVTLICGASALAERAPGSGESKPLDYVIVVTGGELLEGVYPDGHTHYITRTLRPLGCRCVGSMTVDDHREEIQRALRIATNQAPLIIVTGGLGPTPNDITRETLADFTGIKLQEHPDVLADMERRFKQSRDQLRPNLRRQTQVPVRGGYLKNAAGTAVGLIFEDGGPVIVALPGPPKELQPMVRNELVPYLQRHFGVRTFGCSLTLRFVGVGQSQIDQAIKDHIAIAPDVTITSLFEGSRVDFTFSLPGHTADDCARLQRLESSIREHLGDSIYANDGSSLEEVVVRQLLACCETLVLAEVGSGGHLAAALDDVAGSDRLVAGAFVAPTTETLARLLQMPAGELGKGGPATAQALAAAAVRLARCKSALAVGPVESDQQSAKHVWVAFKSPDDRWQTQRMMIQDSSEISRSRLTTQVVDWVRRLAR